MATPNCSGSNMAANPSQEAMPESAAQALVALSKDLDSELDAARRLLDLVAWIVQARNMEARVNLCLDSAQVKESLRGYILHVSDWQNAESQGLSELIFLIRQKVSDARMNVAQAIVAAHE